MSQPSTASQEEPKGDPWHAFGYITSGVAVYGVLGWLADRWLGTSFLVAVGIILGAGLGIFMTFSRFNKILPTSGPVTPPAAPPDRPDQD
jgi:F0F1-type ATP synthase assembly protein I